MPTWLRSGLVTTWKVRPLMGVQARAGTQPQARVLLSRVYQPSKITSRMLCSTADEAPLSWLLAQPKGMINNELSYLSVLVFLTRLLGFSCEYFELCG